MPQVHCTIVNTLYRKPRSKTRTPFSYAAIKQSPALAAILQQAATPSGQPVANQVTSTVEDKNDEATQVAGDTSQNVSHEPKPKKPKDRVDPALRIDFGTWLVDEVQLCEMGSHAPEDDAYVSVGGVMLLH